jgi:hypothetical protein
MHLRQSQSVTRRRCLAVLAGVSLAGLAVPALADEPPGLSYVHDLYRREVDRHNSRGKISNDEFYALFAADLRQLMQAPHPGLAREPQGPILNAFFGWGVLPGQPVKFVQAVPAPGKAGERVRVELEVRDARRYVLVHLVHGNGLWKIANISYGNGESLREYYRRITQR